MIVRTYGRRNRGITRTYSDSFNTDDDVSDDPFGDSQDTPQDLYSFPLPSSQEPSPFWSSQENNPLPNFPPPRPNFSNSETGVVHRSKKQKKDGYFGPLIPPTSTLMEAQEFGEMMEHVDEVNFAIDGLKKGCQVRIRRASLLSLLSICGTAQQRRLLRTEGLAKTIIDAILGLRFDDLPSNLAAATLFYVLTSDGQDDLLLESHSSVRFLIKLLKPVISIASKDKAQKIGSKLLALRKHADIMRDTTKISDSSSSAIFSKVQEILVNCKEMKSSCEGDDGMPMPELSSKWIALLTMEKACLSRISLEDTTGTMRKTGGNFKEKLRELGGLDAVFEIIMNCYSDMEGRVEHSTPTHDAKLDLDYQNLILLLKCLKIMENSTFLSKDNQSHLLGMKWNLDSCKSQLSFVSIIISVIKILSDRNPRRSSSSSADEKSYSISDGNRTSHASELALVRESKADGRAVILISSDSNSEKSSGMSEHNLCSFADRLGNSESYSETTTTSISDNCFLKVRSSSWSRSNSRQDEKYRLLEDSEDPYAFDDDAFKPSKWDLLSGNKKNSRTKRSGVKYQDLEDRCQYEMIISQEESNEKTCEQQLNNKEVHQLSSSEECHFSHESFGTRAGDAEDSTLSADCLLTAVKVLMNLTNDNPDGCKQIAAYGGLETMSLLIASHFSSFSLSSTPSRDGFVSMHKDNRPLTDQELDFLVAILGLLVNLVEKDENNRSQLVAARISLPNSEGFLEESPKDVIQLLCSIFLANQGAGDPAGEGTVESLDDEATLLEGEKEAEMMIVEAYAALLLAFLSTESMDTRAAIAECLPNHNLGNLVPVLERFVAFHLTLNVISPETHKAVTEVIESCRVP